MHSVILSSDLSRELFPNNQGGEFTNTLYSSLDFSAPYEQWSVALSEIIYMPDTWYNVREGYNDVTIRMTGFIYWGWNDSNIVYATNTVPTFTVDENYYRVTIARHTGTHASHLKDISRLRYYTSIKMPGKPFSLDNKTPSPRPRFATMHNIDVWTRNACNSQELEIQYLGRKKYDHYVYEKVYIPPNNYMNIGEFISIFNTTVHNGILNLLKRIEAHPDTTNIKQFDMGEYNKRYLIRERSFIEDMSDYSDYQGIFYMDRWVETEIAKMKADRNFFYTQSFDKLWVVMSTLTRENYPEVICLAIVEEFKTDTNLGIQMNPRLLYQLGYTSNPYYDIQWLKWKTGIDDYSNLFNTSTKTLYSYGFQAPDLLRNPITALWVYCDLIDGVMVGSQQQPLLRILPVNTVTHLISYESLSFLQYRRICKNKFGAIKIWLTESRDGSPLILRGPLIVKLHFVRDA